MMSNEYYSYDRVMTRAITSNQYKRIVDRKQLLDVSCHPHNDSNIIIYIRSDVTSMHPRHDCLGIFRIGQEIDIDIKGKSSQVLDTLMTISGMTHDEWEQTYPQGAADFYYICPIYEQIDDLGRYFIQTNAVKATYAYGGDPNGL